jgi:hypothetical protein
MRQLRCNVLRDPHISKASFTVLSAAYSLAYGVGLTRFSRRSNNQPRHLDHRTRQPERFNDASKDCRKDRR